MLCSTVCLFALKFLLSQVFLLNAEWCTRGIEWFMRDAFVLCLLYGIAWYRMASHRVASVASPDHFASHRIAYLLSPSHIASHLFPRPVTSHRITLHLVPRPTTPHRIASHRIASHRIASHRIASHTTAYRDVALHLV